MELTNLSEARSNVAKRKNSQPLTVECSLESIELKNVIEREIVGSGSFSTVHEVDVVWEVDQQSTRCVAKQLRIGKDKSYLKRIESVCTSLWPPGRRRVEHTNIVSFVGVWFKPGAKPELPMLVFEKMDRCLADFLKTNTEQCVLLAILNDIASGLEFLHDFKQPIVHGDLTAYSIFIKGHSDSLVAKIGDLGVCQILDKGVCPSNSCSSYRSPEACSMRSHVPDKTDDIYACGVLMMHTLLQEYPASRKPGDPRQFSRYLDGLKKHPLHPCIVACLNKDSSERPPAKGVLVAVEAAVCGDGLPAVMSQLSIDDDSLPLPGSVQEEHSFSQRYKVSVIHVQYIVLQLLLHVNYIICCIMYYMYYYYTRMLFVRF